MWPKIWRGMLLVVKVGNKINYAGEKFMPNYNITTDKFLFNSLISTKFSKFLGLDIKDFCLDNTMDE